MSPDSVPCKTDFARGLLQRRGDLPRAHRLFLIMLDGQKPLHQLSAAATQLGIDDTALGAMSEAGLIRWQHRPVSPALPKERGTASAVPATVRTAAPADRTAQPTIAAAKMYAIDLAALMLPGHDRDLRDAARHVVGAAELTIWLGEVAGLIREASDDERAWLFLQKVGHAMPAATVGGPELAADASR